MKKILIIIITKFTLCFTMYLYVVILRDDPQNTTVTISTTINKGYCADVSRGLPKNV